MNNLHHCSKVALLLELSRVNIDQGEKLISIYKIEITRKCKISCRDGVVLYKSMTQFYIIPSLGAIT